MYNYSYRIKGLDLTDYFVPNETFLDIYDQVGGDLKLSTIFEAEELSQGIQDKGKGRFEFYHALDVFNETPPADRMRHSIISQVKERLERIKNNLPDYYNWLAPIASEQVFELYVEYQAGPEALARVVELEEYIARKRRHKSLPNQLFYDPENLDREQLISEYVESELLDKTFADEWKTAWAEREIIAYKDWLFNRESREKTARYLALMKGSSAEKERLKLGPSTAVKVLLDTPEVPGRDWWSYVTPGNIADAFEYPDIKNMLLGGKFSAVTSTKQNSALHMAATNSCFEVMLALVNAGARVNVWNSDGITPLHMVVALDGPVGSMKAENKLHTLINAGAELDRTDHWGQTALHWACAFWYQTQDHELLHLTLEQVAYKSRSVLALLRAGADPKIRNKNGKTAWQLVKDGKQLFIRKVGHSNIWKDPYVETEGYQLLQKYCENDSFL